MDFSTVPTSARVREWQYLKGVDFQRFDRSRTVVTVSCSPLEVHGPHLPVVADNHESEVLMLRSMEKFNARHPDVEFLHLPPLYVASDVVPHPGSIAFRPSTIRRVLVDLGRSLSQQGFRHVWIGSFHGGPRHFVAIEAAAAQANRRHGTAMISVFGSLVRRLTNGSSDLSSVLTDLPRIAPRDLRGDIHGGAVETSLLLRTLPEHVSASYRELRRRVPFESERPISELSVREILRSFGEKLRYFETETYAGNPAVASAEAGERILETLSTQCADAMSEVWRGRLCPEDCRSPLWPLRGVLLSEAVGTVIDRLVRTRTTSPPQTKHRS